MAEPLACHGLEVRTYDGSHALRIHLLTAGFVLSGCASGTAPSTCTIELSGAICPDLSAAGSLVAHQSVIEQEVMRTLDVVRPLLNVTGLRISLSSDPSRVIPEVGMGGFNPSAEEVRLYADPAWPDLESVLRSELMLQLAHEIHHAMRRRAIGYGSTLLQAAVSEGLADHFSLEASGRTSPPPWALAFTPAELSTWIPEVEARASGGYDHAAWFVGTSASIPAMDGLRRGL